MASNLTDLPLAISIGDPAGIGPEIIAKAWEARKREKLPPFFAIGDLASIPHHWDVPLARIDNPDQAIEHFGTALPVFHVHSCATITPGSPDLDGAHCALQALETATGFARSGTVAAVVTGPVSKAQLYAIGFDYPGQTEFVAERRGGERRNAVMMLAGPDLRVVPMTTHIPLVDVAGQLDMRLIRRRIRATAKGLKRDFGIANPRLAVAGFNPHAGEMGNLGREEIDIFEPAIASIAAGVIDSGADALALINTVLGMVINVDTMRPHLGGKTGGLSGPAIRPVAVRAIYQVHQALPHVPILGMDGVSSGRDAFELILAGASGVSVGTASFGNPHALIDIQNQLREILISKGFPSLHSAIGYAHRSESQ